MADRRREVVDDRVAKAPAHDGIEGREHRLGVDLEEAIFARFVAHEIGGGEIKSEIVGQGAQARLDRGRHLGRYKLHAVALAIVDVPAMQQKGKERVTDAIHRISGRASFTCTKRG